MLYNGKKVTVIVRTWEGVVVHEVKVQMRPKVGQHTPFALDRRLRASREGIDWARGWDSEDAKALVVAEALK